jgi:hypothetical protein|tara:strand:- start:6064 stop:6507 length:444 start_codon:yes stop_codon:yes gene_type:complete
MSIVKNEIRNIPSFTSSDNAWILWHENLKKVFGRKKANALYVANWDAQRGGSSSANTSKLRKYLEKNGIKISGGVIGDTGDFFGGVGDYFGDIFTVGKYLGIGLAVIVAISVGGLVVQIAFNRKTRGEAVDVAKALASAKGGAKKPS